MKKLLLALSLTLACSSASALNLFACEPEWAALARELVGDQADIYSATNALQDPHRVEARPSLIAKARRADLVICTGAELEVAWLPVVLRESGNTAVQPGKPGYFEAAANVRMLEVPSRLDRADGDVHAAGNPHIQTDPRNFLPIARALSSRLSQLDPSHANDYATRLHTFTQRWQTAIQRWEKQAAPLRGVAIAVQHQAFPYLCDWLGLTEIIALEPKPGMEPSAAYLAQVLSTLQQRPARIVIRAAYQNDKPSQWIAERAHIPVVTLPFSVGADAQAQNLFQLFDDTVARLLAGLDATR